jgi:hypothetical protein
MAEILVSDFCDFHRRGACKPLVFYNDPSLECTPRVRYDNKEEFSQGELDAQTQTAGL